MVREKIISGLLRISSTADSNLNRIEITII